MSAMPPRRGGNADYLADGMLPHEYELDFITSSLSTTSRNMGRAIAEANTSTIRRI